ncbi:MULTISPECIES: non-ribosomal peptide synthetase [Streptomyces]|uniref:Amino acid adenylation domain-containing protein n=1 Tax=Streptomyces eurythermus TaxID=42237 RepID=A0ABW6Z9A9_9ACTN|nr:non-ribosomal peptide synthetase [Streptomyces sp. DSM 40868]QIS68680.1 amino acid adenylation domain-containing protein [Streptomyces sp. DSM 40868]
MTTVVGSTAPVSALPISASQLGLLVLDQQIPARHLYNLTYEIELTRPLAPELLRKALHKATWTQPALRTLFREVPAPHAVLVDPPGDADFPFECREFVADQMRAVVDEVGAVRFDPYAGPLYRAVYLYSPERAVLVFGVHHIVFCHFSLLPVLEDLHRILADDLPQKELAELRVTREEQYAAELAVHERIASSPETAAQADELAERLRHAAQVTLHPHPQRPAQTQFLGERLTCEVGGEAIRLACQQYGITPYEFFMAVLSATVGRHSSSEDVTIANVFYNRRTFGAVGLAGFFVNTLPVRVGLDWAAGFGDFARSAVRQEVEFTRERGKVAISQVVERLNPERVGNRNPVFNVLFALYDVPVWPEEVRSVRSHGNHTAKFDLWVGVTALSDGWRIELEYDQELVGAGAGHAVLTSLQTACDRAAADPAVELAGLFEDASRQESVTVDGYWREPAMHSLVDWIREVTVQQPERIAIEEAGQRISYADLDIRVSRVATALRELGVGSGDVVGLNLDTLADTTTAMLAVMRIGAAYLPLDGALPADRLEYMATTAGCRVLIGDITLPGVRSLAVADLRPSSHDAAVTTDAEATYVMFTSGSTGKPKGIHMAQSVLRNLTAWQLAALDMGSETRFMQYAPLGFDVSFQEIVPTLCGGGTVVSRESVRRQDFAALVDHVQHAGVTHLYLPVAALRPLAQAVADAGARLEHLTHLCVSGEQLIIDQDIRELFRTHPHCTLINLYGPTETHAVTTARFTAPDTEWPDHAPIGNPLTGVAAYVVDVTGHLAPTGVAGELCLGGACPALGYINDEARTAKAFLPDPFRSDGGTMYRTGDQVLRDETGTLVFLGRDDDQVKIRGFRVELGEVESVARAVPGVRAAVAAVRDVNGGKAIVLFAVAEDFVGDQLRDALRAGLPDYMVPAHLLLVDRIPTTGNGKFDRVALLRDARFDESVVDSPAGCASDLQAELAAMWAQLLNVAQVDPGRSLLDYGAHSIMMFTSVRQINKRYGVKLSITDLFDALTVAKLAARIAQLMEGSVR